MTQALENDEMYSSTGRCIVGCGWDSPDLHGAHPGYCERPIGDCARGVTEPEWNATHFWCSVIRSRLDGEFPKSFVRDSEQYRHGIQLGLEIWGDVPASRPSPDARYQEVKFNL